MKQSIKRMFMATAGVLSIGTMGLFAQNKNDTEVKLSDELKNTNGYKMEVSKGKYFVFATYTQNFGDIGDTLVLAMKDLDGDGIYGRDDIQRVTQKAHIGDGQKMTVVAERIQGRKFKITDQMYENNVVQKREEKIVDGIEDVKSLGMVFPAFKKQ